MNQNRMMLVDPLFNNRDLDIDPELIFAIMPFKGDYLYVYNDHILPVVTKIGLKCKKANDIFVPNVIAEDIWTNIAKARIIIADLSERNPNVFYEVGIAHAIGKDVIMITNDEKDVPFDLKHIRYFTYIYTPRGMKDFEAQLELIINETLNSRLVIGPGHMQAKTALEISYIKWLSTKSLPDIQTYQLINRFSDELVGSMDVNTLALMFRAALQYGENLIYWFEQNENNYEIIKQIDDVINCPYRKPLFRIGLSLEYLNESLKTKIIEKYKDNNNQSLKQILDNSKNNKTIKYWEGGKVESLSKTDLAIMLSQAKSSKRKNH